MLSVPTPWLLLTSPKNVPFVQLFKRRNVCLPGNEESMVESPIQDPDVSSTVPIPEVSTSECV